MAPFHRNKRKASRNKPDFKWDLNLDPDLIKWFGADEELERVKRAKKLNKNRQTLAMSLHMPLGGQNRPYSMTIGYSDLNNVLIDGKEVKLENSAITKSTSKESPENDSIDRKLDEIILDETTLFCPKLKELLKRGNLNEIASTCKKDLNRYESLLILLNQEIRILEKEHLKFYANDVLEATNRSLKLLHLSNTRLSFISKVRLHYIWPILDWLRLKSPESYDAIRDYSSVFFQ